MEVKSILTKILKKLYFIPVHCRCKIIKLSVIFLELHSVEFPTFFKYEIVLWWFKIYLVVLITLARYTLMFWVSKMMGQYTLLGGWVSTMIVFGLGKYYVGTPLFGVW